MKGRSRMTVVGALALCGALALAVPVEGAKKKKGKVGGVSETTKTVNAVVPDGAAAVDGVLESTITIGGKKFKGTKIRDVDVTVTTVGAAATSAADLSLFLTSPSGVTVALEGGFTGQNVGPLTFTDETKAVVFTAAPQSVFQIGPPYVGSARPDSPLATMDNENASGTWTLSVLDTATANTSTLSSWKLRVNAGAPYKT